MVIEELQNQINEAERELETYNSKDELTPEEELVKRKLELIIASLRATLNNL